jgi:CRISPR-associated endonuclease/helicase Cas3
MTQFDEMVRSATAGSAVPYAYQRRIAEDGLPELLEVPTGSGKTMAAVLPWLYRRRFHPDPMVRADTPRWLVFVLPMRVLVEQTHRVVSGWLESLGLTDEVGCDLLMGGEPLDSPWRRDPVADRVVIGTLDMVLSRALNRGFGQSRYSWPIEFGLFNAGVQYVFDEVQLMGPALATSRQLHGLRSKLGEAMPCRSMWMSATVDESRLRTFDAPSIGSRIGLDDMDRTGALSARLDATKTVQQVPVSNPKTYLRDLAAAVTTHHRPGTLTLVVMNTVDRARDLTGLVRKAGHEADVVLLHSRFRPADRAAQVAKVLAPVDPKGGGRIVVSTQVVEAGVDLSATVLFTEAAPWPSVVQRAGRCNRDGRASDAMVLWAEPPQPAPYPAADVQATSAMLSSLEGAAATPASLGAVSVAVTEEITAVLRRRDLLQLFDTQPDLGGNDVDVSRFIREADDLDVAVAWRDLPKDGPTAEVPLPGRDERCPVAVRDVRRLLRDGWSQVWRWDHLAGRWRTCTDSDVRPGAVLLVDVRSGGYTPDDGWDPRSSALVAPVEGIPAEDDQSAADNSSSLTGMWLPLQQHLADVEFEANQLLESLLPGGLDGGLREAAVAAARLHDIGKAHPAFQEMLRSTAGEDDDAQPPLPAAEVLLAKSAGTGRGVMSRRYFRHELVSALALLGEGRVALDGCAEADLVTYLVAAHHGRIRIGLRSLPDEAEGQVLGVRSDDELPVVPLPDGELPASVIDLAVAGLGGSPGTRSWSARALELRDRADIGPFRLGYLEALVRLADWRASAEPGGSRQSEGAKR